MPHRMRITDSRKDFDGCHSPPTGPKRFSLRQSGDKRQPDRAISDFLLSDSALFDSFCLFSGPPIVDRPKPKTKRKAEDEKVHLSAEETHPLPSHWLPSPSNCFPNSFNLCQKTIHQSCRHKSESAKPSSSSASTAILSQHLDDSSSSTLPVLLDVPSKQLFCLTGGPGLVPESAASNPHR